MLPWTIRAAVCAGAMMLAGADTPCQTFDVAAVKPNRSGKGGGNLAASPGMLTIRNLPLRTIIGAAYGIAEYQIAGPQWLKQERFDIVAKTDAPVTGEDKMLPLLQPLLAERFHLAMHHATKQLPAYVLTVGTNGPKFEAADAGGAGLPFKKANKSGGARIRSAHLTMPQFAEILSRRMGYPVLDMTGLAGAYRQSGAGHKPPLDLHRSPRPNGPASPSPQSAGRDLRDRPYREDADGELSGVGIQPAQSLIHESRLQE